MKILLLLTVWVTITLAEKSPDLALGCLPSIARVQRSTGEIIAVAELKIGDTIMINDENASQIFLLKQNDEASTNEQHPFLKLYTGDGDLHVSAAHFIYINGVVELAGSALVGDSLMLQNGSASTIVMIEELDLPGSYSPHTLDGNMVVDGFRTKTHSSLLGAKKRFFWAPVPSVFRFLTTRRDVGKLISFIPLKFSV